MKLFLRLTFIFVLIGGVLLGYLYYANFIKPNTVNDEPRGLFIPQFASAEEVISLLRKDSVIDSDLHLKYFFRLKNYQGSLIVPGKYKIAKGWTNEQLTNHLRAGNGRVDSEVQFNLVQTVEQLAGEMTKELFLDSITVLNWLRTEDNYRRYGFNEKNFLSMFVPNTYFVKVDVKVDDLMQRMAQEYKKFWTDRRKEKCKQLGMTQTEVITLASIVYWETKIPEDMPIVAGVYINRLRMGMPLQADPTVVYALRKRGIEVKRVLTKDTKIDDPYNTYMNKGLPPGPIIIPPAQYVDAVLNYKKHDYIFFVAKEDFSGRSYFSKTLRQHEIYADRYRKALNQAKVYR